MGYSWNTMNKLKYFLSGALWVSCVMMTCAQNQTFRTPVYQMNDNGSKYYRIPALITAGDGSLLAIADRRGDKLGDLPNNISIVCRRSSDMGNTWSDPVYVVKGRGEGKGYGDPCVIYDRNTQKMLCIYSGESGIWSSTPEHPTHLLMSVSEDHGKSWGESIDLTRQIYPSNWYGAFASSGNGLQLENGRLMFVVAARLTSVWGGEITNFAVYSDDHGTSWKVSAPVYGPGDEAKVVELANGDVMMSIRNPKKGFRKISISKDHGETWSMPYYHSDLMDPACNGDIIRVPKAGNMLLHSLPASQTTREQVTLYGSKDNGQSWTKLKQVSDGLSAYSSIAVLPNGQVGMLIEEGKWDANLPGEDGFTIDFVRFDLKNLWKK